MKTGKKLSVFFCFDFILFRLIDSDRGKKWKNLGTEAH